MQVDSLAYMGRLLDKMIEAPTHEEAEREEHEREMQEGGGNEQGRNEFTGY